MVKSNYGSCTVRMQFQVPPKKIAKLKSILNLIIWSFTVTFRDLARVAGFINSLFLALGPIPIARLFTMQTHSTIQARSGWDCSFPISGPLMEELRFWFLNIEAFNGYGIQPSFFPGAVIFCDASDYVFGSFQVRLLKQRRYHCGSYAKETVAKPLLLRDRYW